MRSFAAQLAKRSYDQNQSDRKGQKVGQTVSQYIRALRCEQAARLLRETDLFVSEISAYVGYPDNNYFAKAFKAQYGTTPSVWRAQKDAPTV